jgi:hypothetical protein
LSPGAKDVRTCSRFRSWRMRPMRPPWRRERPAADASPPQPFGMAAGNRLDCRYRSSPPRGADRTRRSTLPAK